MTDEIWDLFAACNGVIDPISFWDYTIQEIQYLLDGFDAKSEADTREQLLHVQTLADLVVEGVAYVLGSTKDRPIPVTERFPDLFVDVNALRAAKDLELHKARLIAFAESHNAARKEFNDGH